MPSLLRLTGQAPELKTAQFYVCRETMASVEIMREDELQRVHFPLPDGVRAPPCLSLRIFVKLLNPLFPRSCGLRCSLVGCRL